MTQATREQIFAALFALLQGATVQSQAAATVSRLLKHWTDVAPAQQPALYLVGKKQSVAQLHGEPPKWTIEADIYLYVSSEAQNALPQTQLNNWLDAIETALLPPARQPQTLGGLVTHCWISGVETDEGTLNQQAVGIISLEIVAV